MASVFSMLLQVPNAEACSEAPASASPGNRLHALLPMKSTSILEGEQWLTTPEAEHYFGRFALPPCRLQKFVANVEDLAERARAGLQLPGGARTAASARRQLGILVAWRTLDV